MATAGDTRPEPLVSASVDLNGMPGFMLDVQRLFASELWAIASGDEFKAAVALWGRAWQQSPPGSLPNDERLLASFSGNAAKWKKLRAIALKGFVECSDGRLYHKTLCEDVNAAWAKRLKFRERTSAATAAKIARNGQRNDQRNVDANEAAMTNVTPVQGTGDRRQGTVDGYQNPSSGQAQQQVPPREPTAAPRRSEEILDFEEIERRCVQALGYSPKHFDAIASLIRAGHDLESRILPIIREARDAEKGDLKTSWRWFAQRISDASHKVSGVPPPTMGVRFVPVNSPEYDGLMKTPKASLYRSLTRVYPQGEGICFSGEAA